MHGCFQVQTQHSYLGPGLEFERAAATPAFFYPFLVMPVIDLLVFLIIVLLTQFCLIFIGQTVQSH